MNKIEIIGIRAHTLMCLQGYRGLGYSPEFIEKMDEITDLLNNNPATMVRLLDTPDIFCHVCPNLVDDRCVSSDSGLEGFFLENPDSSTVSDRKVLAKLGFEKNSVHIWSDILEAIAENIIPLDMDYLCGECRWREFDYCAKALDKLSRSASH
jgi:uncharacterized protein